MESWTGKCARVTVLASHFNYMPTSSLQYTTVKVGHDAMCARLQRPTAIKTLRNFEAHYNVVLDTTNTVRPRASKTARRQQGPPGERQLERGIRASHLRKLAAMGYDRSSSRGLLEWAAALVAWNLLLRGGELGVVSGQPFDTSRDATFGAIEWREPCSDSDWLQGEEIRRKPAGIA